MKHPLLQSLYSIEKTEARDDNEYRVVFSLDPANEIFQGHFPEQPVLPGVAMIDIVRKSAENILNTALQMETAANIKFLNVLIPDANPYYLLVKITSVESFLNITARIFRDDVVYFKLNARYIRK